MDIIELPYQPDSESLFFKLQELSHCIWLDSGDPGTSDARYDIFSALPSQIITGENGSLEPQLEQMLSQSSNTSELPFSGGWIGYFEYAYNHHSLGVHPIPENNHARFGWYDWGIVVDHKTQKTQMFFLSRCPTKIRKHASQAFLAMPPQTAKFSPFTCSNFSNDEEKSHYGESIARIKDYLYAGDCYQVNYTQRFSAEFAGSSANAFICLRKSVPSPFSAFLNIGEKSLLSISPERFIRIDQRDAVTQPIKGTAQRGQSESEDRDLKLQLKSSAKNLAENLMIVDLLRNDFGQLCITGSVKVPHLFEVQSFANVHHLVSTICGTLPDQVSHVQFVHSCFPGGSITGAPKKRAMQIIEELERFDRGAYCGSIGYFSCNQKSDFNIAIRTMEVRNNKIYAWAGGGIVVDSETESEYKECFTKIQRLMHALERGSESTKR